MRIFLIYPLLSRKRARVDENKQFWPPLGLAYIAAVMERAGHSVRIMDRDVVLRREGLDFEKTDHVMLKEIEDFRPDYVGISATTPNMPDVGMISEKIKERVPAAHVILGGPHGSALPQETLEEFSSLDMVVIGEGERTMLDIVSGVEAPHIKGIAYRRDGKAVVTGAREPIENIDELPMPGRRLLEMDFYLRPSRFTSRNLSLRTTSIFTARGCPYRCDFCAGPLIFPGHVRYHSAERVLSEIDELAARYRAEALYFAEDMFLSHKKRAIELLEAFLRRPWGGKLKWFAQARVNVIDQEMCELMKRAGCVGVEYGFESGSQRILDVMRKAVKVEENLNAARITREAGLRFQANIIAGYPGETREDFEATIRFLQETKPDNIGFNLFMPLPGTMVYRRLKEAGSSIPPWDEIGDPEMSSVSYAAMSKEDFERLYLTARFKVILPMNFRNFIMANLKNPLRLVFLLGTQFWGTAVKSLRGLFRLRRLERVYGKDYSASQNNGNAGIASQQSAFAKASAGSLRSFSEGGYSLRNNCSEAKEPLSIAFAKENKRALFVSYNAATEPLVRSQVIPYLAALSKDGIKFTLLTFEKSDTDTGAIRGELESSSIEWVRVRFHSRPLFIAKPFDIASGIFSIWRLCASRKFALIHSRGVMAAVMALIPAKLMGVRLIFDMKSSLAEAYRLSGRLKADSILHKALSFLEKQCVLNADEVILETKTHKESLEKTIGGHILLRKTNITVLPCCVDTGRFCGEKHDEPASPAERPRIVYLGSLSGWYLISEMLDFFKAFKHKHPQAELVFLTDDKDGIVARLAAEKRIEAVRAFTVPYKDVCRELARSTAGILFKHPNDRLDSFPIKVGEYLASGLPLIINHGMGDVEELVVGENVGVVVKFCDDDSYSEAVNAFTTLLKEGVSLKKRCLDTAKRRLSLSSGLERYRGIYDRIVK